MGNKTVAEIAPPENLSSCEEVPEVAQADLRLLDNVSNDPETAICGDWWDPGWARLKRAIEIGNLTGGMEDWFSG